MICICTFLGFPLFLKAQTRVSTSFERGNKGEYIFYVDNPNYCPYTVKLIFSKLENADPGTISVGLPFQTVVKRGRQRVLTLNRMREDTPINIRYTSRPIKGDIYASVDTNFVYLLPVKPGKKVRINRTISFSKFMDAKKASRITGLVFKMEEGDTVYACRAGIIVETQDYSASTGDNTAYSSQENFVEVYHKDGSFAMYKLFKNNGIFVKAGETVAAGQPIGIIGGSNYDRGSHLRFRTYYLSKNNLVEDENGNLSPQTGFKVFTPVFHLSRENDSRPVYKELYTSEHPETIIIQDMSKSQKKKYFKKHRQK